MCTHDRLFAHVHTCVCVHSYISYSLMCVPSINAPVRILCILCCKTRRVSESYPCISTEINRSIQLHITDNADDGVNGSTLSLHRIDRVFFLYLYGFVMRTLLHLRAHSTSAKKT